MVSGLGYHAGYGDGLSIARGVSATEGIGTYIATGDPSIAADFAGDHRSLFRVRYTIAHPVRAGKLYILQEDKDNEIFDHDNHLRPMRATGSDWYKAHYFAFRDGVAQGLSWNQMAAFMSKRLTWYLVQMGYDGVNVGDWVVAFHPIKQVQIIDRLQNPGIWNLRKRHS